MARTVDYARKRFLHNTHCGSCCDRGCTVLLKPHVQQAPRPNSSSNKSLSFDMNANSYTGNLAEAF